MNIKRFYLINTRIQRIRTTNESESLTGRNVSNLAELQFSSVNNADLTAAKSTTPSFCVIFGAFSHLILSRDKLFSTLLLPSYSWGIKTSVSLELKFQLGLEWFSVSLFLSLFSISLFSISWILSHSFFVFGKVFFAFEQCHLSSIFKFANSLVISNYIYTWWVLGRTKHVYVDMYTLNLFIEHSREHWWEQNIFLHVHQKHFG